MNLKRLLLITMSFAASAIAIAEEQIEVRRFDRANEVLGSVPRVASSPDQCFLAGEKEGYEAILDREQVSYAGCARKYDKPVKVLPSKEGNKYEDGTGGYVNCSTVRYQYWRDPHMRRFSDNVLDALTRFKANPVRQNARCALALYTAAARKGAFLETRNDQGKLIPTEDTALNEVTIARLVMGYLTNEKVRAMAGEKDSDAVILTWFAGMGEQLVARLHDRAAHGRNRTNLQYTNGFAVLAIGVATGNRALVEEARTTFADGLKEIVAFGVRGERDGQRKAIQVEDEGMMYAEMGRGKAAITYTSIAARSLVGLAALSKVAGCDFIRGNWPRNQIRNMLVWGYSAQQNPELAMDAITRYKRYVNKKGAVIPIEGLDAGVGLSQYAQLAKLANERITREWLSRGLPPKALLPNAKSVPANLGGGTVEEWYDLEKALQRRAPLCPGADVAIPGDDS